MTRRARRETPALDPELTVPGLRVPVVNEASPDAPAPQRPSAHTAAPAPDADAPAVQRRRRIRFVF